MCTYAYTCVDVMYTFSFYISTCTSKSNDRKPGDKVGTLRPTNYCWDNQQEAASSRHKGCDYCAKYLQPWLHGQVFLEPCGTAL